MTEDLIFCVIVFNETMIHPPVPTPSQTTRRPLVAVLVGAFYCLFTLFPDSSTWMLSYPGVIFWQFALLTPVVALIMQIFSGTGRWLGHGLDWMVAVGIVAIVQSGLTALFPQQARWYGIAALGMIAALYACNDWLNDLDRRQRILTFQGILQLCFIGVSLGLWTFQTAIPELARLQGLERDFGIAFPFSFEPLENRNWAPIGHQNYVAGYLTLAIPSLVGLGLQAGGNKRWIWFGGALLGLIDLYTTSSRAGLMGLGLGVVLTIGILLGRSNPITTPTGQGLPKKYLILGSGGFLGAIALILFRTGRLQGFSTAIAGGYVPGELAYRIITNAVGLAMGTHAPLTGTGIGSAAHVYERFRPIWAGREAELAYQLHSTPAQLWGELGILGLGIWVGVLGWLGYVWWKGRDRFSPLTHSLFTALFAYGFQSLTDYQLDNLGISGTIVIFIAAIAAELPSVEPDVKPVGMQASKRTSILQPKPVALGITGLLLAAIVWLIPIDRAWMISKQGFEAIATIENPELKPDERTAATNTFTQSLETAHQLVPWEPYYPQQLGWVLGDLGQKTSNPDFISRSIQAFETARESAPYQEFVYTSLGFLQLDRNPKAATEALKKATQLVPAKRGGFEALGLSLVLQQKPDLAIDAFALELTRNPKSLPTLSTWKGTPLEPLIRPVIQRSDALYTDLINQAQDPKMILHLQSCRGALRWWTGNPSGAKADAEASDYSFLKAVLLLGEQSRTNPKQRPTIDLEALKSSLLPQTIDALTAWNDPGTDPSGRSRLLRQAWIQTNLKPMDPALLDRVMQTLQTSQSLDDWLKNSPIRTSRRQRSGFNVLSRHTDGINPEDFAPVPENLIMQSFMGNLIPEWKYYPLLEIQFQSYREALWAKI